MQKYVVWIVLIFVSLFVISCTKTDDTKPFFDISSPLQNDTFLLADTILFQATFYENEGLSHYKIEIKNNFTVIPDTLPAWNLILVNSLFGKEQTVQLKIPVQDSIFGGEYFFIVKALDAEGNEALADTTAITIQ